MKSRICSRCRAKRRVSRLALILTLPAVLAAQKATVPFVGCRSEGQADPVDAPTGKPVTLPISLSAASRLAYFKANASIGVLGPRGWNCLGTYGSSGAGITIGPGELGSRSDLPALWPDGSGPVIDVEFVHGDGSGGYLITPMLARLFPAYRASARGALEADDRPVPSGPFPTDRIVRKSDTLVEFRTPPHTDGMGTYLSLKKNANPIDGAVILLNEKPDVLFVFVRLPAALSSLSPVVIHQVESESLKLKIN